jgi:serine/threonine protein kinase
MRYRRGKSKVELDDEPEKNLILIEEEEFFLENMDAAGRQRGANSSVFRAVSLSGEESYIVKFCRFAIDSRQQWDQRRTQRFAREIQALTQVRDSKFSDCVIRIIQDEVTSMRADWGGEAQLNYYVMEEADSDLTAYLEQNELSFPQQLFLCSELLRILKGLHALGIYHRDIKATNILMRGDRPLFSDLGLINYRAQDQDMDTFDERIGPVGFLSPEATNKFLGLRGKSSFSFDCWIDDKSDVFQLGQVFWLVLQSEVPTGHLTDVDVKFPHLDVLGTVIHPMLQYGKERRANLSAVESALLPVLKEVALV